jgi:hypothetical protein
MSASAETLVRILFTLYSKAEVLEAVGHGSKGGAERFRHLLQREHPDVKFKLEGDSPRARERSRRAP